MWRYRLLLLVLSLPLLLLSGWQAIRQRDARLLLQRIGIGLPTGLVKPVWIHVASVGEVNAVLPFLQLIRTQYPAQQILVTTNTPTGKQVLKKHLPGVAHSYLAIDWRWLARRFVRRVNPCCALVFETEIWPNLFAALSKQSIPLIIFNGRVSSKTLRAQPRYAGAYQYALQQVDTILARSEQDRQHFMTLGAAADKVQVIGNIKYAAQQQKDIKPVALEREYVLLASTRDDEEAYLLDALGEFSRQTLLVIAPRHPQRRGEIEKYLVAAGVRYAVRSREETIQPDTQVYLADTLGELAALIAGARFVIMGGSFLPFGGHNILEVAQQGKAVIFGPHMDNFADEAASLLACEAAIQVNDPAQLVDTLQQLVSHPGEAERRGQQGKTLVLNNADIAQRYLQHIGHYCSGFKTG